MALVKRDLASAEADLKAGQVYGPFASAKELVRSLHRGGKETQEVLDARPLRQALPRELRQRPSEHSESG